MSSRGRSCAFRDRRGGAGRSVGVPGEGLRWRQGAVSPAADAGAADLCLRERHFLLAADGAGEPPRHRRAFRGRPPASGPRPAEIARREALAAKLDAACARLEAEARAEAEAARPDPAAGTAESPDRSGQRADAYPSGEGRGRQSR